jgi:hypothetical protein
MSEDRSPDLGTLLDDYVSFRLDEVYVMRPGIVQSYDAIKNTVEVLIAIKRKLRKIDDSVTLEDFAVLKQVPVAFQRCGKGYLTFPIAKNDRVAIFFADKNLGAWIESKQVASVDAEDVTPHPLSGAFCVPGLYPISEAITPAASTSHVVLATDGSSTHVLLGDNDDAGMQFVALAQKVYDEINALRTTVNTNATVFTSHIHPSGMGPTGTPASPATNPSAVQQVAAERVKAK